jgi:IS5 family transposase
VSRTANPQISFADWELKQQNHVLNSILQGISEFLNEHVETIEKVRCNLEQGLKNPETGDGLTPAQVLRSLVLMLVKNWDYRELRERITDGYSLRIFTEFYSHAVPRHDAFNRSFNRLTPATLKAVNEVVVKAAVDLGLEDGKKLRVDTTVVQTDIHHPTDNTLLWDVVRPITRLVGYLVSALEQGIIKGFHNRTRAARRRMLEIQRMTIRQRGAQQTDTYRALIDIADEVVQSARSALEQSKKGRGKDAIANLAVSQLRKEIDHYCKLGDRVIDQARRRVLEGEQVPTADKVYSIFEPHTDLIKRGKILTPVEFGNLLRIAALLNKREARKRRAA